MGVSDQKNRGWEEGKKKSDICDLKILFFQTPPIGGGNLCGKRVVSVTGSFTTRIWVFCMDKIRLVATACPCNNPLKCQLHGLPLQQLPLQQPPLQLLNFRLVAWVIHAITSGIPVATVCPCNKYPCNKYKAVEQLQRQSMDYWQRYSIEYLHGYSVWVPWSICNDRGLSSCMGKVCGSHGLFATIEE